MHKLIIHLLLAIGLIFSSEASVVNDRIILQEYLTSKAETSIRHLLGEDVNFSLYINIEEAERVVPQNYDIGYLPGPLIGKNISENSLDIKRINAELNVFSLLSKEELASAKLVLKSALVGYRSRVNVRKVDVIKSSPTVKRDIAPQKENLAFDLMLEVKKSILQNMKFFIILASVMLILGMYLISKLIFKNTLLTALKQTAESIESFMDKKWNQDKQESSVEIEEKFLARAGFDEEVEDTSSEYEKDNIKMLEVIGMELARWPNHFANSIDEQNDFRGIRQCLSYFNDEQLAVLSDNLNEVQRNLIIEEIHGEEDKISDEDFYNWLVRFKEKLIASKMKKESQIHKMLGSDVCKLIQGYDIPYLINAAKILDNTDVWKIVVSFLPQNEIMKMIEDKQIDIKEFVQGDQSSTRSEILKSSDILLESLGTGLSLEGDQDESVQLVIDAIISKIRKGDLLMADMVLEKYGDGLSDIIQFIHKKQWTPDLLLKVDPLYMKEQLDLFSKHDLLYFFVSLPEKIKDKLLTYLPENEAKIILVDSINVRYEELRSNSLGEISKISWDFLDRIQKDYKLGKFELEESIKPSLSLSVAS